MIIFFLNELIHVPPKIILWVTTDIQATFCRYQTRWPLLVWVMVVSILLRCFHTCVYIHSTDTVEELLSMGAVLGMGDERGRTFLSLEAYKWQSSVQFSRSVMSDSLQPHESQHARPPCPSQTPGVYSNSCPSSQ